MEFRVRKGMETVVGVRGSSALGKARSSLRITAFACLLVTSWLNASHAQTAPAIETVEPSRIVLPPGGEAQALVIHGSKLGTIKSAMITVQGRTISNPSARIERNTKTEILISIRAKAGTRPGGSYQLVLVDATRATHSVPATIAVGAVVSDRPISDPDQPIPPRVPPETITPGVAAEPRKLTIASIGESFAAGEGAPDRISESLELVRWENRQCHRSLRNGRVQAIASLNAMRQIVFETASDGRRRVRRLPVVDIDFRQFACSGATGNIGLLGPYAGIPDRVENRNVIPSALSPQIDQVKVWLEKRGNPTLDALIISVGGNDVGFGKVVADCLTPAPGGCNDNDSGLTEIVAEGNFDHPTQMIGFENLPDMYQRLAEAIEGELKPRHVLITEYPNPLKDENGRFCGSFQQAGPGASVFPENWIPPSGYVLPAVVGASTAHLNNEKTEWVFNTLVSPLNRHVQDAAQEHGWHYVSGVQQLTNEHGYCAEDRWVNTLVDSFAVQGDAYGTAHPNYKGHKAYGFVLAKALVEIFELPQAPPPEFVDYRLYHVEPDGDPVLVHTLHAGSVQLGAPEGRKRIRFELAPTTHPIIGVELEYAILEPGSLALRAPRQVTATRDSSEPDRLIYWADVPGTASLPLCAWFHVRGRVRYPSLQRLAFGPVRGVQITHQTGAEPDGGTSVTMSCDPVPA